MAIDLINCLKKIEYQRLRLTCALISEIPSNMYVKLDPDMFLQKKREEKKLSPTPEIKRNQIRPPEKKEKENRSGSDSLENKDKQKSRSIVNDNKERDRQANIQTE